MRHSSAPPALVALTLAGALAGCQPAPAPAAAQSAALPPCVHFRSLQAYLPATLEGFEQVEETGSTGKYDEVSVSEAERVWRREGGGREVAVRIVDTTLVERLASAIHAAAEGSRAAPREDPGAPLVLEGTVGFVRYDAAEARAEANLLVAGRFVVAVTSRGFPGTVEVRRVARTLDLAGLARLRGGAAD